MTNSESCSISSVDGHDSTALGSEKQIKRDEFYCVSIPKRYSIKNLPPLTLFVVGLLLRLCDGVSENFK
jgi:hypothetical protein